MDVQRAIGQGEAEDQTAWTVLVVWILFNDLSLGYSLTHLLHADMADDALVNGVLGEFKLAVSDLGTDFFKDRHKMNYSYPTL